MNTIFDYYHLQQYIPVIIQYSYGIRRYIFDSLAIKWVIRIHNEMENHRRAPPDTHSRIRDTHSNLLSLLVCDSRARVQVRPPLHSAHNIVIVLLFSPFICSFVCFADEIIINRKANNNNYIAFIYRQHQLRLIDRYINGGSFHLLHCVHTFVSPK